MKRNFIAIFATAAILASCGVEKKPAEQEAVQPVVENTVAEPTVYEHDYIVQKVLSEIVGGVRFNGKNID